ncbi:saccharopine dehydrogenase NADP-binding domain-containing protein [Nocardia alba]|uniref:Saccharopine dehydrogenase-like protein n=1 Tax=Nocardia alba TaxID=225051 RepID=A0A4R1FQL8_9NOCA|nr:saccharopine dehydrogenase NADP-binding domain-containing protein [Nocardia alba]TCJ96420.1 saccharopine dehydrogenase-like protein [Nocardia alba]
MSSHRAHEVAVFGATGYTGKQIVRELLAAGRDVVCVGRDRATLEALTATFGQPVPIEIVDLTDRPRLEAICAMVTTVVNAAGSFAETCEPIARAAITTRTHYLDISGEQSPIRFVFDELHDLAVSAGIAVIPSAAFYAALADMLVPITAAGLDRIDTVDIAYDITDWTPSGAAYNNFLRGIGQPVVQFDHGFIDVATPAYYTADFGRTRGAQRVFTYPAPEVLTLPRHQNIDRIRTSMTTSTFRTPVPDRLVPTVTRAIGKGLRGPAAPLVKKVLEATTGSSHDRIDNDPTRFRIAVTLRADTIVRTATLAAAGIFDITAPIAARIAEVTLHDSFEAAGALAPAQVVDPKTFLAGLTEHGLSYHLGTATGDLAQ